jgi:AbrB family looped-hinge helix DNA binding protein
MMIAKVSTKGQMVIPESVREQARIQSGDELEVGFFNGLVVLRKHRPLTPARVRSLLLAGRELPEISSRDEDAVGQAIERVRNRSKP